MFFFLSYNKIFYSLKFFSVFLQEVNCYGYEDTDRLQNRKRRWGREETECNKLQTKQTKRKNKFLNKVTLIKRMRKTKTQNAFNFFFDLSSFSIKTLRI